MSTASQRATLVSSGEHIYAVRRLGENYSDAEYLRAIQAARDVEAGERYADSVLGIDVDAIISDVGEQEVKHVFKGKPESLIGVATQRRADEILRRRGLDPESASQSEMLSALLASSS